MKRRRSGDMSLGCIASMMEAEQVRRIICYWNVAKLAVAAKHELHRHPIQDVAGTLA
jgi:hypothetical protein